MTRLQKYFKKTTTALANKHFQEVQDLLHILRHEYKQEEFLDMYQYYGTGKLYAFLNDLKNISRKLEKSVYDEAETMADIATDELDNVYFAVEQADLMHRNELETLCMLMLLDGIDQSSYLNWSYFANILLRIRN